MTLQNSIFLIIFAKIVEVAAVKQPLSDALVFLELLKEVIVKHPNSLDGWPCERLAVLSYNCDLIDLSYQPPGDLQSETTRLTLPGCSVKLHRTT